MLKRPLHRSPMPSSAIQEMQRQAVQTRLTGDLLKVHNALMASLEKYWAKIDTKVGPKGERGSIGLTGPRGPMPDLDRIATALTAEVMKRVVFPKNGTDGKNGTNGEHGKTPQRGVDYMTQKDIEAIAKIVAKSMKPTAAKPTETTLDPVEFIDAYFKSGKKLKIEHVDGLKEGMEQTARAFAAQMGSHGAYLHGSGIPSLAAGTNITLTPDGNGGYIVSSTGGSGSSVITVTGTIDDSNTSFSAVTEPTQLVINGGLYRKTGGSITWTYVGTTITLSIPVGTGGSIYGLS